MKPHLVLFIAVIMFFAACENKQNTPEQTNSKSYPHIDTIKIGLKSDSGHYALLTYYKKHIAKDTSLIDGAEFTQMGNEKWKVVTVGETIP